MKTCKIFLMLLTLVAFCCTACNNDTTTASVSSDSTITSFSVSNDSVSGVAKVKFTIDSDSNVIYNTDSLPYLTPLNALIPTIYGSTLALITINDSITYTGSDTIDFTNPVTITTLATDGESTRTYIARVCAHQIDPDVYNWQGVKSEIFADQTVTEQKTVLFGDKICLFTKNTTEIALYTSNDGKNWSSKIATNLPATTDLIGIVEHDEQLLAIAANTLYTSTDAQNWNNAGSVAVARLAFAMNNLCFAFGEADGTKALFCSNDLQTWNNLGALPAIFPDNEYAVCVDAAPSGKMRAYIIGGKTSDATILNTVWSTEDGSYWTNLAANKAWFTPRYGAAVVQYADGLMLLGGADENGVCNDKQWYSPDYGLTWREPDSTALLPDLWLPRHGLSVVMNSAHYLYIVGGQANSTVLSDVWTGRKNSEIPGFKN